MNINLSTVKYSSQRTHRRFSSLLLLLGGGSDLAAPCVFPWPLPSSGHQPVPSIQPHHKRHPFFFPLIPSLYFLFLPISHPVFRKNSTCLLLLLEYKLLLLVFFEVLLKWPNESISKNPLHCPKAFPTARLVSDPSRTTQRRMGQPPKPSSIHLRALELPPPKLQNFKFITVLLQEGVQVQPRELGRLFDVRSKTDEED